jgi:maltose-binding protein MalE
MGLLVIAAVLAAACAAPVPSPSAEPTSMPALTPSAAAPTESALPSPTESPALPTASATPVETPTPSPTTSPTTAPTLSAPPGAVTGTLTVWADSARAPVLSGIAIQFTEETGVPLQVYEMPFDDIVGRVAQLAQAGNGPDIFIGAHDRLGELVSTGAVEPLDLAQLRASFRQVAVNAFTYGGQVYGMPYLTQGAALFYNKSLLAGGVPPATWTDLKDAATAFQAADSSRQGFCLPQGDPYHSYPLLTGFGGYLFGKSADGSYVASDVGLDSTGGLASANELDSMVKAGLLRAGVDYDACLALMTSGKALFWVTGPWALPDLTASGIDFGVAPIPTMAEMPRPFVGAQGFMVSHYAANREAALTYLFDYVATDDVMLSLWEADPRLPAWNEVADSISDPNITAFLASVDTGDPIPAIPEMSAAWVPWTAALNAIYLQQEEPDEAFRDAAAAIRGQ